jgi:hypothetical protein
MSGQGIRRDLTGVLLEEFSKQLRLKTHTVSKVEQTEARVCWYTSTGRKASLAQHWVCRQGCLEEHEWYDLSMPKLLLKLRFPDMMSRPR